MWTLAIVVPCPLSGAFRKFEDPTYRPVSDKISHIMTQEEEHAHAQATTKVQTHFARLGFLQAGRTPALAEFFFSTRDSYFKGRGDPWSRLLSRDQVGALDLYAKPAPHRMNEVDKDLRTLLELHAVSASGDIAFQQRLLMAEVMRTDRFALPSGSAPSNGSNSSVVANIRDLVLVKGASINGARAVHCAAGMGPAHLEILVELLHLGGDPNLPDEIGNTPLHAAASSSNLAVIKLLKLVGASTAAVNAEGETPLDRLLAQQKSSADFAATFRMPAGFSMKPDPGPTSEAIQLLLSPDQGATLIGGAITPRMAWYLRACGEVQHDVLQDLGGFEELVPPAALIQLPGGKLSEEHRLGMSAVLLACVKILEEKSVLCVTTARAKALGGMDRGSVQAMLDAGLKVEFVLDYLFEGAEESFRTGQGYVNVDEDEELQEELAAIAPHPLDAYYDAALYSCCIKGGEPLKQRGPFE
jgi:Ankyrin repeats (many copies)